MGRRGGRKRERKPWRNGEKYGGREGQRKEFIEKGEKTRKNMVTSWKERGMRKGQSNKERKEVMKVEEEWRIQRERERERDLLRDGGGEAMLTQ